jgi:hypothetical protein
MPDETYAYEGLTISVRERPDQGYAEYGVVIDGVFHGIGGMKLGDFQEKILEGGKATADEAEAKAAAKKS